MDLKLHDGQLRVFIDNARFRVAVAGRRFGKSRAVIYELLLRALMFPGSVDPVSPEVVLGIMPTLQQARGVLWQPLVSLAETDFAPVVDHIDRTNFCIFLRGHKPCIKIRGANDKNGDGLRGLRVYFACLDEYQDIKPGVFENIILPAMADTEGSRAIFTGTPKGKLNHLYQLASKCNPAPGTPDIDPDVPKETGYVFFNLPTRDNPTIPRSEIEFARRTQPPKIFRQEYEASFESFEGKIYTELDDTNKVSAVPERFDKVIMGIDFGDVHPCAVVLGGVIQNRHGTPCVCWYFLEGWENTTGHALPNPLFEVQLARLAKKHGVQMSYADPSRSSLILGNQALGRRTGNPGLANNIAGFNNIIDGITQVHSLIFQKLLLFPVGTQGAIRVHETPDDPGVITPQKAYEYLSAYHWETDKNGISTEEPADGQFSHCCDSTRYALAKRTGT